MHDRTAGWTAALIALLAAAGPDSVHAGQDGTWSGLRAGAEQVIVSDVALAGDRTVTLRLERFRVTSPRTRFVVGQASAAIDFDPD